MKLGIDGSNPAENGVKFGNCWGEDRQDVRKGLLQ
jgi:hypothetical protein